MGDGQNVVDNGLHPVVFTRVGFTDKVKLPPRISLANTKAGDWGCRETEEGWLWMLHARRGVRFSLLLAD